MISKETSLCWYSYLKKSKSKKESNSNLLCQSCEGTSMSAT